MSKLQSSIAPGPQFRPFWPQNAANVARERFYEGRVVLYVLAGRGKRDNTFVLCSAAAELSVESPSSLFALRSPPPPPPPSASQGWTMGTDTTVSREEILEMVSAICRAVRRGQRRGGGARLARAAAEVRTRRRRDARPCRGKRARAARRGARDRGRCRGVHGAPAQARGGTCRGRRARGAGFHAIGAHRGTGRRARGVRRGAAARGVGVVGAVPWRTPARRGRGACRPRRRHVTGGDNARPRRSRNP